MRLPACLPIPRPRRAPTRPDDPCPGLGGPHLFRVELVNANEFVELHDIFVGEVRLAYGQSNMSWKLESCAPESTDDIVGNDFPDIRMFTTERRAHLGPQSTSDGDWQTSTPANAPGFSAIAYGFGGEIYRALGVPVMTNLDCTAPLTDFKRGDEAGLREAAAFMDANECHTINPAARQAGRPFTQIIDDLASGGAAFGQAAKEKFGRKGEW